MRGPKNSVKKGKTPVLIADEARDLLGSIQTVKKMRLAGAAISERPDNVGLRDRALIALMAYTFARVGAAAGKMRVEDVYVQERRTWVRLHEKGGKRHEMPCHHKLEAYLHEYIEAAGIKDDLKSWLFRHCRNLIGNV